MSHVVAFNANSDLAKVGPMAIVNQEGVAQSTFAFPDESWDLARDRVDWKAGRVVSKIRQFRFGELTLPLGHVVVASGKDIGGGIIADEEGQVRQVIRVRDYYLVAEIDEDCPVDPFGRTFPACLAIMKVSCTTFPEEFFLNVEDLIQFQDKFTSLCFVSNMNFIWGKGFEMDAQLVAVVAGVLGRALKTRSLPSRVMIHAIPAAFFTMATIGSLPSQSQHVSPSINATYICFMLLPIIVMIAIVVYAFSKRESSYPIPSNGWQLMILGHEHEGNLLPKRMNSQEPFPKEISNLCFGVVQSDDRFQVGHLGIIDKTNRPETTASLSKPESYRPEIPLQPASGSWGPSMT